MKKTITTITILIALTLSAVAQNGGGLFQRGFTSDEATNTRESEGLIGLPSTHGSDNDAQAPLGSGIAVLAGLGASYAWAKKRKEE